MNNAYSRLDTNINRAAAGSNALAALHPLDFDPADKASFAVGYGHYHNANAAAVGAFYQPNANTMVNMGISLGNGDPGFNAGVSFKIGKGSTYNGVSKAEMAQTIHDQAAEISTIKANDAAKDKRIDALEKENQEMKKQIQEILARCEMSEIYIVNPYECFLLMCLLTDCPLAVFSEIWEKSYEEGEEKN